MQQTEQVSRPLTRTKSSSPLNSSHCILFGGSKSSFPLKTSLAAPRKVPAWFHKFVEQEQGKETYSVRHGHKLVWIWTFGQPFGKITVLQPVRHGPAEAARLGRAMVPHSSLSACSKSTSIPHSQTKRRNRSDCAANRRWYVGVSQQMQRLVLHSLCCDKRLGRTWEKKGQMPTLPRILAIEGVLWGADASFPENMFLIVTSDSFRLEKLQK